MKTTEDFQTLIQNYQNGTCSPGEKQLLENWYNNKASNNPNVDFPDNFWQDKQNTLNEILDGSVSRKTIKLMTWPLRVLFIAATVAVIGSVWTILFTDPASLSAGGYSNDINPGGNKAILITKSGKRIVLSDNQSGIVIDEANLTYSDGTLIENGISESFSLTTPRGGTYRVRLPDHSMVWLNAASNLTYNISDKKGQKVRYVKLKGEAYFQVAKNKRLPFVVATNKQEVTVLGTHFNINSYADENIEKTTLLEGSVRIELTESSETELGDRTSFLKPGQEAVNSGKRIEVRQGDPALAVSWTEGDFLFKAESLEEIMKKVGRWYDVEVEYEDPKLKNNKFSGGISKYEKVSKVLCMLELAGQVKFEINGRKIKVLNKKYRNEKN